MRASLLPDDSTAIKEVFVADRRRRFGNLFRLSQRRRGSETRIGETERTLKQALRNQFESLTAAEVLEPSL
jgi:hypothetical protein